MIHDISKVACQSELFFNDLYKYTWFHAMYRFLPRKLDSGKKMLCTIALWTCQVVQMC